MKCVCTRFERFHESYHPRSISALAEIEPQYVLKPKFNHNRLIWTSWNMNLWKGIPINWAEMSFGRQLNIPFFVEICSKCWISRGPSSIIQFQVAISARRNGFMSRNPWNVFDPKYFLEHFANSFQPIRRDLEWAEMFKMHQQKRFKSNVFEWIFMFSRIFSIFRVSALAEIRVKHSFNCDFVST